MEEMYRRNRELLTRLARERLREGDLFAEPAYVVPIQTRGRAYGSISRAVSAAGVGIPSLQLTESFTTTHQGRTIIFVAFWDDGNDYTEEHVARCVMSAVVRAYHARVPHVAVPLLGGKDKTAFLGAMELGVEWAADTLEALGFSSIEVSFVSNLHIT